MMINVNYLTPATIEALYEDYLEALESEPLPRIFHIRIVLETLNLARTAPCEDCYNEETDRHPTMSVRQVVLKSWQGWKVTCDGCGVLLAEYDLPEDPQEHRSI